MDSCYRSSGERVLLYNVTCVLDALDEQGSKIVRFDDGGILTVEKYEFLRKVVAENEIFKLPGRSSPVFVTDDFVERVRQSGLRGCRLNAFGQMTTAHLPAG